jgi:pyruvate dehydrogenase E2 component (dihydrolipoamide acetyltransferase)
MPIEITMPKLTDTMTDATLAKWLKKEGDKIKPGDMIAEVETDKATQELETFDEGTLAKIVLPEGAKANVGALIGVIAKPGEDVAKVAAGVKASAAPAAEVKKDSSKSPKSEAVSEAPKVVKAAESSGNTISSSEPAVALIDHEEGAETESLHFGKIRVSPLAKKIAAEKNVDLNSIRGTGPDGRIIKRDVIELQARAGGASSKSASSAGQPKAPAIAAKLEAKKIPLTNMRQTIAKRLQLSKQTIPHFYVSIDIVMDSLLEIRRQANETLAPEKLTVTDFIARGVAMAIARVPEINSSFTETEIIQHGSVELGIAVSLENGLVVPVLRGAHNKSLRQISAEIKQLAADAKAGKLKIKDLQGSTFTISNMGMYGIKDFMAIVNPPEGAILAVGGTEERPIVKNGAVVVGHVCTLTLSADHRVVDGALGAKFLAELKKILENPIGLVL